MQSITPIAEPWVAAIERQGNKCKTENERGINVKKLFKIVRVSLQLPQQKQSSQLCDAVRLIEVDCGDIIFKNNL